MKNELLDDLDEKVLSLFPGKIVRKDLIGKLKGYLNVPAYVLEYLLGQYCSSDDKDVIEQGLEEVKKILSQNYARPDQSEMIKSIIKSRGYHKVIDKIKVRLIEAEDTYWAELLNTQITNVNIDEMLVNKYEKLLVGGLWAVIEIQYDPERIFKGNVRPFVVKNIKPIQLVSRGLQDLQDKRSNFSRDEWLDFIIRSLGYEPTALNHRLKMIFICRLIPLVENNYNLVELGPRGTGKSFVYRDISPYCILISGGETTVPSLFVSHAGRGKIGLVGVWDTVAFDEVAGLTKLRDVQAVQILKDYMESGSFSRGKEQYNAMASLVFVGNIDYDIDKILRSSHLFIPFPEEMRDAAFLDRFHAYIPGWEVPKMHQKLFGSHYGFIVDHLAEFLRDSRKLTYWNSIDEYFRFGDPITKRDEKGIRKTVSGLIKILHPDGRYSKEEMEEYLQLGMELRRRVREQLKKMGGIEYYNAHFSYFSNSKETEVNTPEQEAFTRIKLPSEPKIGEVLGLAITQSYGTIQKFEVIANEGVGRLIPLGSMMKVMRESLKAAYEYMSRNHKALGISADFKKDYDITVLATQMGIPKEGPSSGIAILVAMISAMTKKPVRHDVAMTGEITLKGRIISVGGIQEKLIAASESGIRRVYIPKENKKDFESLPDNIKASLEVRLVETVDEVLSDALIDYDIGELLKEKQENYSKILELSARGEGEKIEFKSSLRWDHKQNAKNKMIEGIVAKTIVGFLNSEGGHLLIGVKDNKEIIGLEKDFSTLQKQDEDGFELHLTQVINNYIGIEFRNFVHTIFEQINGKTVCLVAIDKSTKPAYLLMEGKSEFYIRAGNSTEPLDPKEAHDYITSHWRVTDQSVS